MIKKCKICGKEFDDNGTASKYCSEECRAEGTRLTRMKWREANREKERLRSQQRNQARREAIEKERKHQRRKYLDRLNKRIKKGDAFSEMLKALQQHGKRSLEYWSAFQKYELDLANHGSGYAIVNGIPVNIFEFPDLVVESIKDLDAIVITRQKKVNTGYKVPQK